MGIRRMHERLGTSRILEEKAMLNHGLEIGCGRFRLDLDDYQYQKLR